MPDLHSYSSILKVFFYGSLSQQPVTNGHSGIEKPCLVVDTAV